MNPLAWLNPARWMLYAALCAALVGGYAYWAHHEREVGATPYIAQLAAIKESLTTQKTEAAAKLAAETAKVKAAQASLDLAHFQQEKTDELNKQNTDGLVARLHALTAAGGGRLRDPYAAPAKCRCSGGDTKDASAAHADSGTAEPGLPGGLLSPELSRFLESKFEAAERLNGWYASCRADAQSVRGAQP